MYSSSSGKLLCGSELALFLTGGSDWRLCDECAMKIRTQNHLLESTAQIVACLNQNLCSVHEAGKPRVFFLVGWPCLHPWTSTIEWPAKTKAPTLLRTYGLEVASQARGQSTGFVWQATNRAVDTRRVILCSGSHRTLIAQSWVRPPARNRFSSDPQRSASLPKEYVETQSNILKINKTHKSYKIQRKHDETYVMCM